MPAQMVKSIVIVGGGTAGWMAAALLARKLAAANLQITLVESAEIGTIGVGEATVPTIRLFNQMLGIDEHAFLRATRGTYKLGIEFVDWGAVGTRHFHGFGDHGPAIDGVSAHHFWHRLHSIGDTTPIDAYSFPAMLAQHGKFTPGQGPELRHQYAYHFDAALYAGFLRNLAERWGVVRQEGRIVDVVRHGETGAISALRLAHGETVGGDLFIDCSGFAALLLGRALATPYVDWSAWLPCDSAVAVPCASDAPPAPFTRATARADGWQWRIPLQHRDGNGLVYSSAHCQPAQAEAMLMANLAGEPLAEPRHFRFTAGRRAQFWRHNCIAIGFAGGFLEPLESTAIQLIQSGIARLIEHFPHQGHDPRLADEYNRIMASEWERIRDFIIGHYAVTRRDEPLWADCRAMTLPDTLAYKLDLWRATGRVALYDSESHLEPSWVAVLLGNGCVPAGRDARADMPPLEAVTTGMARRREDIARAVRACPDHRAYIERHCRAGD